MFDWKIGVRNIGANANGIFNGSPKYLYSFKGGFIGCNSPHKQLQKTLRRVRCLKMPSTKNSRHYGRRRYFHSGLCRDIGFVICLSCGVFVHYKARCRAINPNSKGSLRSAFALINLLTKKIILLHYLD